MAKAIKQKEEDKAPSKGPSYIVVSPFRSVSNFNEEYQIGDDVSHFDKDRLDKLVSNNLVELK